MVSVAVDERFALQVVVDERFALEEVEDFHCKYYFEKNELSSEASERKF
jgi:hypothetical protein